MIRTHCHCGNELSTTKELEEGLCFDCLEEVETMIKEHEKQAEKTRKENLTAIMIPQLLKN